MNLILFWRLILYYLLTILWDLENNLKTVERDNIVYLEDKIDKLFEMYPKSFNSKCEILLKMLSKNENKITKICLTKFYYLMVYFMKLVGGI